MRVLSLFDGISGAAQALKELEIECEYYASEIDKFAIQISQKNHPEIKRLGDVKSVNFKDLSFDLPDLLIGGSPCQDLSIAGKGVGLLGERSGLFFQYLRILQEFKPKFFVLENVASMKNCDRDRISELLGIQPIKIDSALLTAQQRKRYYWVGKLVGGEYQQIAIQQPKDKQILLKNILENSDSDSLKSYCIPATYYKENVKSLVKRKKTGLVVKVGEVGFGGQGNRVYDPDGKSICLSANSGGLGSKTGLYEIENRVRKLTPIECERLQGFPDNYTHGISQTQRYKSLGNSFTVPVIKHIISTIFKN